MLLGVSNFVLPEGSLVLLGDDGSFLDVGSSGSISKDSSMA